MPADHVRARTEAVARYKTLLREAIDRRPSGLRGRLARALGKHKSFITQITSPAYSVPIPAKDLPTILIVCHLSNDERAQFLDAYQVAHPERARRAVAPPRLAHELRIALPSFRADATARSVETLILDFAARVITLAQQAEGATDQAKPDRERTS